MMKKRHMARMEKLLATLALALALLYASSAFTGTVDGNVMTGSTQTLNAPADIASGNDVVYGGSYPIGKFSGAYDGYLGLNLSGATQTPVPSQVNITLISPLNNSGTNSTTAELRAQIEGEQILNCSAIMDGTTYVTINNPSGGILDFDATLPVGSHSWKVRCFDQSEAATDSNTWYFTVFSSQNFDSGSTDLTNVDVSDIDNLTLVKSSLGRVVFIGSTDLSGGADLDTHIKIGSRSISINSAAIPVLNKSAILTMYNADLENPVILADGRHCRDCQILSNSNDLVFQVPHFTNYSASENSLLRIWDDTDYIQITAGKQIGFYANYSNLTSGEAISGMSASCDITISGYGTTQMFFNSTTDLYYYNRSLNATGPYPYQVFCNTTSGAFSSVQVSDFAVVSGNTITGVSNITKTRNERANYSLQSPTLTTQTGNLTPLNINSLSVSSSWQGYFGNVSGMFSLQSAAGSVFYEWPMNQISGELYATRSPSVDFQSINCSGIAQIALEEQFIGQQPTDAESVTNTFTKVSHPSFKVGLVNITQDKCQTTNLYVDDGPQNATFYEILLSDAASTMVYTTLLESDQPGFDTVPYDFQMIVGEDGKSNQDVTTYYFFIDLA